MTGLGLPLDDFRVITLRIGLDRAEKWSETARRDGYGDDLSGWLRDLADRRTVVTP